MVITFFLIILYSCTVHLKDYSLILPILKHVLNLFHLQISTWHLTSFLCVYAVFLWKKAGHLNMVDFSAWVLLIRSPLCSWTLFLCIFCKLVVRPTGLSDSALLFWQGYFIGMVCSPQETYNVGLFLLCC